IAQLGAGATLLGLLFVGLSLNLAKIIANPALPTWALIALVILLLVLVIASLMVIPRQTMMAIAIKLLVIGAGAWLIMTIMDVHVYHYARLQSTSRYAGNMVLLQVATLPLSSAGSACSPVIPTGSMSWRQASSSPLSRQFSTPGCSWSR